MPGINFSEMKNLTEMVEHANDCKAKHLKSIFVQEEFRGKVAWEGYVELFELEGNPKAKRCYAWEYLMHDEKTRQFISVLEISPVESASTAVLSAIASGAQK